MTTKNCKRPAAFKRITVLGATVSCLLGFVGSAQAASFKWNGSEYFLTNQRATWENAQLEAINRGGNLVTINDAEEQAQLASFFSKDEFNQLWIGLTDKAQEGVFEWISGQPLSYTNWFPGEPNNFKGNEDYVVMNWKDASSSVAAGNWNDLSSTARRFGIIEIEDIPESGSALGLLVLGSVGALSLVSKRK